MSRLNVHMRMKKLFFIPVTQRCAVTFGELLHFVVVRENEERSLDAVHLLDLGHHVLIDTIHDLLQPGDGSGMEGR